MSINKQVVGFTVVADASGEPLVVYRGEHGGHGKLLNTRLASLSFSSYAVAKHYALNPNHCGDVAVTSIVIPAMLRITQPFFCNLDDTFIDFSRLVEIVGKAAAIHWFLQKQEHVMNTNAWADAFGKEFRDVHALVRHNPELLYELSVQVWPLLDDSWFIELLQTLGYDGAVYRGSAISEQAAEYRVFDREQVLPLTTAIEYVINETQPTLENTYVLS